MKIPTCKSAAEHKGKPAFYVVKMHSCSIFIFMGMNLRGSQQYYSGEHACDNQHAFLCGTWITLAVSNKILSTIPIWMETKNVPNGLWNACRKTIHPKNARTFRRYSENLGGCSSTLQKSRTLVPYTWNGEHTWAHHLACSRCHPSDHHENVSQDQPRMLLFASTDPRSGGPPEYYWVPKFALGLGLRWACPDWPSTCHFQEAGPRCVAGTARPQPGAGNVAIWSMQQRLCVHDQFCSSPRQKTSMNALQTHNFFVRIMQERMGGILIVPIERLGIAV